MVFSDIVSATIILSLVSLISILFMLYINGRFQKYVRWRRVKERRVIRRAHRKLRHFCSNCSVRGER